MNTRGVMRTLVRHAHFHHYNKLIYLQDKLYETERYTVWRLYFFEIEYFSSKIM